MELARRFKKEATLIQVEANVPALEYLSEILEDFGGREESASSPADFFLDPTTIEEMASLTDKSRDVRHVHVDELLANVQRRVGTT